MSRRHTLHQQQLSARLFAEIDSLTPQTLHQSQQKSQCQQQNISIRTGVVVKECTEGSLAVDAGNSILTHATVIMNETVIDMLKM
jgi:hypothetical protein